MRLLGRESEERGEVISEWWRRKGRSRGIRRVPRVLPVVEQPCKSWHRTLVGDEDEVPLFDELGEGREMGEGGESRWR